MTEPQGGPEAAGAHAGARHHGAQMSAALVGLVDGAHLSTPDELPAVVATAARHLGLEVEIFLVTFDQRLLVPLPGGDSRDVTYKLAHPVAGRAFREVAAVHDGDDLWLPLLDGVDRLGALHVRPAGEDTTYLRPDLLRSFVLLVGHLVALATPYGDTIIRTRGTRDRTVEAELLWTLLPPLTYATRDVVISALLEPCERVAGDAFDYAADGSTTHVAIFDGSGHDLASGLLTSVALATYRNHRRRGAGLVECARAVDDLLVRQTDGAGYATGVLAELDTRTGVLRYVNAGHPRPVLLRGGRFLASLERAGRPLFGLGDAEVTLGEIQLERGDQVVMYTDGITEARAADGTFFGVDRFVGLLEQYTAAGTPPPEMLRLTMQAVLAHQHDVLQDDASIVVLEWGTDSPAGLDPE
jgi:hypothetical protein